MTVAILTFDNGFLADCEVIHTFYIIDTTFERTANLGPRALVKMLCNHLLVWQLLIALVAD